MLNTPLEVQENMDGQFAVYAQDSWRLRNFTINYGIRYDRVAQSIVGQDAQVGRFANVPAYGDFKVPTWSDFSPRTSVVWDIFGNGKTAIRTGFNRFMTAQTTGFARLYAPTALTTANLPWTDTNGDDIAQGERGCTYLTAGCEINFANLPANFGLRALATPDADIQRPGQYTFNLGVTQEVLGRVTLTAEWYHNRFTDITERNNVARTFDSYTPVSGREPARWHRHHRLQREARVPHRGAERRHQRQGHQAPVQRLRAGLQRARCRGGARVFGGFNLEKTLADTCSVGTDPNLQRSTATSGTATSRGRSSSSWPASTRCPGAASP